MNDINKQKFLAELAKLLTFMYEEDRQRALGAYTDMFDEAEDEQALLQALVSPLRQAVEVARAYNAGKPALDAKKLDDGDEDSHFMETIYRIRAEAFRKQAEPEVVYKNQISLFDAPTEAAEEELPNEEDAGEAEEAPSGEQAEPEAEAEGEAKEAETEGEPAGEPEAEAEPAEEAEEAEASAAESPAPAAEKLPEPVQEKKPEKKKKKKEPLPAQKTVRRPRVLLLILYILLAVPVTLVGVALLLIPTIASLAAAAACIVVAVFGVMSAFGSFPKIANLLVALGVALILFALGLLFLMLFLWFIGGAIGGLIRGVIALGGKCCFKEVAAA